MISWFRRLVLWWRARKQIPGARPATWPTHAEMAALPPFEALGLGRIREVSTPEEAREAHRDLMAARVVGFDTESAPIFIKGRTTSGPHVAQFATREKAYVFPLHHPENGKVVRALIASPDLKKVGFGLDEDLRRIPIKLGVQPKAVVDLESLFRERGYGRGVGVKVGVAIVLKRQFLKSRKASTSNWRRRRLTDKQLLYAANDAYAPVRVYYAMGGRD